jgi:hypothetical protein
MSDKEQRTGAYEIRDPEALAHNLARVVEEAGKAAAAFLKPRGGRGARPGERGDF